MLIYEVYYINEEIIKNGFYDEDGFYDDYDDYTIEQHISVKYYKDKEKAIRYCVDNNDKEYHWKEIKVE